MDTLFDKTRPPAVLRVMDGFVWLCLAFLTLLTVIVMVFSIGRAGLGGAPMYVEGYTGDVVVEHVQPSGKTLRSDLSESFDVGSPETVRFLSARVQAEVEGFGPRLVLIVASVADLALAWIAIINVQRLTRSSMRGDVFSQANAARLARLGWTAIAYPVVVWFLGRSVFQSVLSDEQVGVTGFLVGDGVDGWVMWLGVGLLLHTLARAFTWGIELQDLETATI